MCAYLLNASLQADEKIARVFAVNEALETGNYAQFWELYNASDIQKQVPQFGDKTREMILHVVGLTFQCIDEKLLLTILDTKDASALLKSHGFTAKDGQIESPVVRSSNASAPAAHCSAAQKVAILEACAPKKKTQKKRVK